MEMGDKATIAELAGAFPSPVNARGPDRWTPLHVAAHEGDGALVELLLRKGAEVNARDVDGVTPLDCAAHWEDRALIELLLRAGADVNAKRTHGYRCGWTALHRAVGGGRKEIAETLLAHGADAGARDDAGWTPLHMAAMFRGGEEIAEVLIARGADVNAKDGQGMTPLHWAAKGGSKSTVEVLIAKGADVNAKANEGETPLDYATIWEGNKDVADALRKAGAKE